MQSLSPLAVLQRGYALVEDEKGALIRSVAQLATGQTVHTRIGEGAFSSTVTTTTPAKKKQIRISKDKPTSR
jgi:exodeoxyribonuclease VII large subunit